MKRVRRSQHNLEMYRVLDVSKGEYWDGGRFQFTSPAGKVFKSLRALRTAVTIAVKWYDERVPSTFVAIKYKLVAEATVPLAPAAASACYNFEPTTRGEFNELIASSTPEEG